MPCPICKNQLSLYTNFSDSKYVTCLNCNLNFQDPLPPKVFEGPEENLGKGPGTGHLMPEEEKTVNALLADSLRRFFHPRSVLDVGTKYPYFLSQFQEYAEVLGIDAVEEVKDYGKELNVPVIRADFESPDLVLADEFDLITLIHTFEHFYDPVASLQKVVSCLSKRGIIFIRIPNSGVEGIERDFTEHHLKIHPFIYSTQTMYILAEKVGCEIFRSDHYKGVGQSDFYLRVRRNRPNLSVCMIVKNEEKNIKDCLESIKDIADELIVVDTGSTDRTKDVVSAYTDLIYDFKWVDDFSVARNYSLSKATGNFVAWFDADDILDNPEDVKALLKEDYDVFNFNVEYGNTHFKHCRLFRNYCNVRFAGRVHEYPIIDGLRFKESTNIKVHHKVEKFSTLDRRERNRLLLQKEFKDNPDNPRTLFYLGNTLRELGNYSRALEIYDKYLEVGHWKDERWMVQKYIGQIHIWEKKYKEAIKDFEKAVEIDDRWAESYYYIGECNFYLEEYENCIEWMYRALKKDPPDSPLWKEAAVYGDAPYRYLFASYAELDNFEKAYEYCKRAHEMNPDDSWLNDKMIFFKNKLDNSTKIFECYRQGALGDCLMTTAALSGLKEKYPGCFVRYVTHDHSMQILEGNKFIDELVMEPKDEICEKVYFSYPDKDSLLKDEGYPDAPLSRHLVKIFCECAGLDRDFPMECTLSEKEEKMGQSLKFQFKKYITIHAKSGFSPYKDWYNDRWALVIEELFKKGYVTVQIGHSSDPLLVNVVDFRGHSVKDAIVAIKYADLHIGVDSFTNHASATVKTPAIILFGSTSPTGSGYDQNKNIYKGLECQPCYREYESKGPCPYNKKCMDLISVEEVLDNIFKVLQK